MNELLVEVHQTPGEIACNFDEIEAALKTQMTAYEELEVTEGNIQERKADVATLRKIKTAVDEKRKEVKKSFNAPLDAFEKRVKSITGIIDEQINRINKDLDVFEQKRIAEKEEHIKKLYAEHIGDYAEFLPLSVVRSEKWSNKTYNDNAIISDIQERVLRVRNDLDAIRSLGSEIEEKLVAIYKSNGNNLQPAIKANADYLEAKKAAEENLRREAERKAREEAERKAREEEEAARKIASEAAWGDEEQSPTIPVVDTKTGETVGEISLIPEESSWTIRVKGAENISALRDFLELSEIDYTEV